MNGEGGVVFHCVMAEAQPSGPRLSDAVEITSIQPGGGFCIGLEMAWGRLRRAWLRRFRPGYVARMAQERRGECESCPHDIIDWRDLKLYRNVCGYWFEGQDDRLRRRGPFGLARTGLAEVVTSSLVGLAVTAALGLAAVSTGHWAFWVLTALAALTWFQAVYFFRDPRRVAPVDSDALVSPSDGVVTHIHEVDDPDFPGGRAFRISIYLSPLDVHLNRVPRDGNVLAVRYFPGRFLNARHKDCAVQNEQLWVDMQDSTGRIMRIKQISGAMARRLVCWLEADEAIRVGERYGMIKYGSRADVLLAAGTAMELAVEVGDRVYAGTTILLRFHDRDR